MNEEHPILGIDYGDARIGLAITDLVGIMAHPLETIERKQICEFERIETLVEQRNVRQIVVGLPLTMEGKESASSIKVRKFVKELKVRLPASLPIHFADERFTTVSAAQKLHQAGKNTKKQKKLIDQAAAVEILTDWLNLQTGDFF